MSLDKYFKCKFFEKEELIKEETLHDQFQHPSSLLYLDGKNNKLSYFAPSVGCDPSQGYFKKHY